MNFRQRFFFTVLCAVLLPIHPATFAQTSAPAASAEHPAVHTHRPPAPRGTPALSGLCASCVRSNLSYLAGPQLHGRGSGTEDEHRTAEFIAGKLKEYGLAPAAENGEYIQAGTVQTREVSAPPTITYGIPMSATPRLVTFTHGREVAFFNVTQPEITGKLQKLDLADASTAPTTITEGAVVLLKLKPGTNSEQAQEAVGPYMQTKAAMLIIPELPAMQGMYRSLSKHPPHVPREIGDRVEKVQPTAVIASPQAFDQLWAAPAETQVTARAALTAPKTSHTWNVLAKIEGTTQKDQVILLSAHLDHLGVKNGKTYPGADDDASGTVAVMELARALSKDGPPKRTVIAALWGSEEAGMIGSRYFLQHPTFDLKNIVANLEFEMIARPDPKVKPDQLWLSGWERSDLGPQLAAHGAKLVGDPHPEQNFFARSDNYALAKQGIVAQTVSSFGLHKDYHQPTDTLARVSWNHLDQAIASMIAPVRWLADSDFQPQWKASGKP